MIKGAYDVSVEHELSRVASYIAKGWPKEYCEQVYARIGTIMRIPEREKLDILGLWHRVGILPPLDSNEFDKSKVEILTKLGDYLEQLKKVPKERRKRRIEPPTMKELSLADNFLYVNKKELLELKDRVAASANEIENLRNKVAEHYQVVAQTVLPPASVKILKEKIGKEKVNEINKYLLEGTKESKKNLYQILTTSNLSESVKSLITSFMDSHFPESS